MKLHKSKYSLIDAYDGIEYVNMAYGRQAFPVHHHEGYAMGMLSQGLQRFRMKGIEYQSGTEQLVVINADTGHTGEAVGQRPCCYQTLYPTPEQIKLILEQTPYAKYGPPSIANPITTDSRTKQLFLMTLQEINQPTSRLCLETLLYGFILSLLASQSRISDNSSNVKATPNIARAIDYIQSFYGRNISLDELCFISHLDKNTLLKEFKRVVQTTPHQYLIQVRINKAKNSLKRQQALSQIAFNCGFTDQSHFTRCFKKFTSVTPNNYRQSMLR